MTSKNIAALPAATIPLTGTEVVPLWVNGTKKISIANITAGRNVALAGSLADFRANYGATGIPIHSITYTTTGVGTVSAATGMGAVAWNSSTGNIAQAEGVSLNPSVGNYGAYVIRCATAGVLADVFSFEYDGTARLLTGNLIQGTPAKGIDFTANTPAAGMTSQLLNWYEEGTWTPTDASGAGLSLTEANCQYTRVGRLVTVSGRITYPSTANTAATAIGGLPATSSSYASAGVVTGVAGTAIDAYIGVGATVMNLYSPGTVAVTNATMSTRRVNFSITYMV